MRIVLICFFSVCIYGQAWSQLPSFPSAEGYGAKSIGGRYGKVLKVTNLNSNGPGSLQAACAAKGPRIVVFDVAGVIRSEVVIKHPYITIAGQTAPEPGITIAGRLVARSDTNERLHDIIIRFLRVRPPPVTGYSGDAVQISKADKIILDHVSMSWANDETIDIIYSADVSIQWCSVEESDPEGHGKKIPHNHGILSTYPGSGNVSIHHNLFAHHARRIPSLTPYEKDKPADFRNNVVYNFREGLGHDGHKPNAPINLVGNYYKRGPNAGTIRPFRFSEEGRYFLSGNYLDNFGYLSQKDIMKRKLPDWIDIMGEGQMLKESYVEDNVKTDSALLAYKRVLTLSGAFPRDRVTKRTVREVISGGGSWGRNADKNPPDEWFLEGLNFANKNIDSDNDGIPDGWEKNHGLDPEDAKDNQHILKSGYPAIEEYINQLAEKLIGKHSRAFEVLKSD